MVRKEIEHKTIKEKLRPLNTGTIWFQGKSLHTCNYSVMSLYCFRVQLLQSSVIKVRYNHIIKKSVKVFNTVWRIHPNDTIFENSSLKIIDSQGWTGI